jgi:predicted nucleic acid-binding protein
MFLLDTMTISEMRSENPNAGLADWLSGVDSSDLYLSVITVAELWIGIEKLPNGRKRSGFEASFMLLPDQFQDRIIPVDFAVAVRYAAIQANAGPLPVMDTLIGATAVVHRLTVITRNTVDLGRTGARILDPWT